MSRAAPLTAGRRASDAGRGLFGLSSVLVLVIGVPIALFAWVGWPLPTKMPTVSKVTDALQDSYIPDEFLLKLLACICWVIWIELVASLTVEAIAYLRGRKAGRVPMSGGVQKAAARLVATIALLGSLWATKGMHDAANNRAPLPMASEPQVTLTLDDPAQGGGGGGGLGGGGGSPYDPAPVDPWGSPSASNANAPMYEVQRRDTLWDIAETHLGDPFRWREIFELNEGKPQPDGRCLTNPDMIYPGWQLILPADAVSPAPPAPTVPAPAPAPIPDTAQPTEAEQPAPNKDPWASPTIDKTSAGSDAMVMVEPSEQTDTGQLASNSSGLPPESQPGGTNPPTTEPRPDPDSMVMIPKDEESP